LCASSKHTKSQWHPKNFGARCDCWNHQSWLAHHICFKRSRALAADIEALAMATRHELRSAASCSTWYLSLLRGCIFSPFQLPSFKQWEHPQIDLYLVSVGCPSWHLQIKPIVLSYHWFIRFDIADITTSTFANRTKLTGISA
jgi:hypothetical protein